MSMTVTRGDAHTSDDSLPVAEGITVGTPLVSTVWEYPLFDDLGCVPVVAHPYAGGAEPIRIIPDTLIIVRRYYEDEIRLVGHRIWSRPSFAHADRGEICYHEPWIDMPDWVKDVVRSIDGLEVTL